MAPSCLNVMCARILFISAPFFFSNAYIYLCIYARVFAFMGFVACDLGNNARAEYIICYVAALLAQCCGWCSAVSHQLACLKRPYWIVSYPIPLKGCEV